MIALNKIGSVSDRIEIHATMVTKYEKFTSEIPAVTYVLPVSSRLENGKVAAYLDIGFWNIRSFFNRFKGFNFQVHFFE